MPATRSIVFSQPCALTTGEVHLWLLDLVALDQRQLDTQRALLSSDELARALRFKRGPQDFIATRLLVRRALSYYTGQAAAELAFNLSPEGKPTLAPHCQPRLPLAFNLSHSGSQALLAIGLQPQLGVDIEDGARQPNVLALARRFYHPAETAYIAGQADDQQHQAFFRLWTLKEAFFKALGTGLATGMHRARFDLTHEKNFLAELAPELHQDTEAWQFYTTCISTNYHCALAAASRSPVTPRWFNANELLFGAPAAY